MGISVVEHSIPTSDGYVLAAILLKPPMALKGVVQVNSATGVKKEFYKNLSLYIARHGYAVILFDYRGIGSSKPKKLKGFKAHYHEWGSKDMAAVLDWAHARFPELKKFIIGHSGGGTHLGFMHNHSLIHKAFLFGSAMGYWANFDFPFKYFALFIWRVFVPVTSRLFGYMPASWFGLGEDLPLQIANEWKDWCLSKEYFNSFLGKTIKDSYYKEITYPICLLYGEDDPIANTKTVNLLANAFSEAPIKVDEIILKDHHLKKLGHFGFFSRNRGKRLWSKIIIFFET